MDIELLKKIKNAVKQSTGRSFSKVLSNTPEHFVALLSGKPPSSIKGKLLPLLNDIGRQAKVEEKKVVLLMEGKAHSCAYASAFFWYIPGDAERIDEAQVVSFTLDPIGTITIIAQQ